MTRIVEGWPHGTVSTYRRGCRCDQCRDAKNSREREWRASRRRGRGGPIAPANVIELGSPAWRPRWFPPACPACGGFGYVDGHSRCRSCAAHPGHAMSFGDWDIARAKAEA